MDTKEKQLHLEDNVFLDFIRYPSFIPSRVPYIKLPEPFQYYIHLLDSVNIVYTETGQGVRKYLEDTLQNHSVDIERIDHLNYWQKEKLFSVLTLLAHCYRWNYLPPPSEEYQRSHLEFPISIWKPLTYLADLLGLPYCGTHWSTTLFNFQLKGTEPGQSIILDEIQANQLTLCHSWVPIAFYPHLEQWIRIFVMTEVEGAIANKAALHILAAIEKDSLDQVVEGLDRLQEGIVKIASVFNREVRGQKLSIEHWRNYIQPTFIWGLVSDDTGMPLEGASGLQVGCIQLIDLVLGSKMESKMGKSMLASRKYFPKPFRELFNYLEPFRNHLVNYVKEKENPLLSEKFNQCVEAMEAYRVSHKQRGKVYIKGDGSPKAITTTGLSVNYSEDAAQHFEVDMDERIAEMKELRRY